MSKLEEIINSFEALSVEELEQVKTIAEKEWLRKRQDQIIALVEEARKESAEGKTLVLSSPEEIKSFFEKLLANEN
jgi:hypothetical protein